MSKRLQVVVRDEERERYARAADAQGLTLSEWARQALRATERRTSRGDPDTKLAAIRNAAATYNFPAPDIETMLAETEAGRLTEIEAGLDDGDAA
jgi:hypothetical protein